MYFVYCSWDLSWINISELILTQEHCHLPFVIRPTLTMKWWLVIIVDAIALTCYWRRSTYYNGTRSSVTYEFSSKTTLRRNWTFSAQGNALEIRGFPRDHVNDDAESRSLSHFLVSASHSGLRAPGTNLWVAWSGTRSSWSELFWLEQMSGQIAIFENFVLNNIHISTFIQGKRKRRKKKKSCSWREMLRYLFARRWSVTRNAAKDATGAGQPPYGRKYRMTRYDHESSQVASIQMQPISRLRFVEQKRARGKMMLTTET